MEHPISIAVTGNSESQLTTQLPERKSAGLAWLLSLLVPGAGHLYAGLYLRSGLVLAPSLIGVFVILSAVSQGRGTDSMAGAAILSLPVLWAFGFVDAYFSTIERNRGIDPTVVDNPRVGAVLNLTTRGFGYFYLGERAKGIAVFAGLGAVTVLLGSLPGRLGVAVSALLLGVAVCISIHAYRIGLRSFEAQVATMELPPPPPPSRVPPILPLVFAGVVAFILMVVLVVGFAMQMFNGAAAL